MAEGLSAAGRAFQAAAVLLLSWTGLRAQTGRPFYDFRYQAGQAWTLEDTVSTQVPDPETGEVFSWTVRGRLSCRVEATYHDGSGLVLVETEKVSAGSSSRDMKYLPAWPDQKPPQYLVMTPEGETYGPFPRERGPELKKLKTLEPLLREGPPWTRHKLPRWPIAVGANLTREWGEEIWKIERLRDQSLGGVDCAVYRARLRQGRVRVLETLWFSADRGYAVKKTVSEDRSEGLRSTTTQVRSM